VVLGVAGIGLALTGPLLGSVVAIISAVVGVAGGLLSFAAGIPLMSRDVACMERLRAIDRTATILRDAARLGA
jgi:hypothetical protein